MVKIISLFNHKGGVGKTTSTASLGWRLAAGGARVLLVDADPQCNLTGFLVDPAIDLYPNEGQNPPDALERFYQQYPRANIRASLAPILGSDELLAELGINRDMGLVTEIFRVRDRNNFLPNGARPLADVPATLYLLAGHPFFYEFDSSITLSSINADAFANSRNIPGCFYALFTRLAAAHNFDYILIDLSPSASITNRFIILSSEFLIVPCSTDFFSYMAIKSLATLLPQWDDWKSKLQQLAQNRPLYPLPEKKPVFLGHTFQLYTLTSRGTGAPAMAYQRWIDRINQAVIEHLIPALSRRGMALDVQYWDAVSPHIVAVRNYQSVAPASSKCHLPAFSMTLDLMGKAGSKSGKAQPIIDEVRAVFQQYAQVFHDRWDAIPQAARDALVRRQRLYTIYQKYPPNHPHQYTPEQVEQYAQRLAAAMQDLNL